MKKATPISQNFSLAKGDKRRSLASIPKKNTRAIAIKLPTVLPSAPQGRVAAQDQYAQFTISAIEDAVTALLACKQMEITLNEVYLATESLYRLDPIYINKLWLSMRDVLENGIKLRMEPVYDAACLAKDAISCSTFANQLATHCMAIENDLTLLSKSLTYIDRYLSAKKCQDVYQESMAIFGKIFMNEPVYSSVCNSTVILFQAVREGYVLYDTLNTMFDVVKMISKELFESLPVVATEAWRKYAKTIMIPEYYSKPLAAYLRSVLNQHQRFTELMSMLHPFHASNFALLDRLILDFSLEYNLATVKRDLTRIVFSEDWETACLLGKVVSGCVEVPKVYDAIPSLIQIELFRILEADHTSQRDGLIQAVISFRANLSQFASSQSLDQMTLVNRMIKQSWSKVIMGNPKFDKLIIESLAKYLDRLLKQKNLTHSLKSLERENIILLFRALEGKADFLTYYQRDLGRRLLGNKSNLDNEISLIAEFEKECGPMYTQSLKAMTSDIEFSKDIMDRFKSHARGLRKINFNANLLTEGKWPGVFSNQILALPPNLTAYQEEFEKFYKSKHQNRKLTWAPARDMVVVKASFISGPKELYMNMFQAIIILLFNDEAGNLGLTYLQISKATGIAKEDLNPALHSLVLGKVRLLTIIRADESTASTRMSKIGEYSIDDRFHVVSNLKEKSFKLVLTGYKVGGAYGSKCSDEDEMLRARMKCNRNLEIQAAIVRVMKMQKRLAHSELFNEVAEAIKIRGPLVAYDFKKALEDLMAPGNPYVVRDNQDSTIYIYSV